MLASNMLVCNISYLCCSATNCVLHYHIISASSR